MNHIARLIEFTNIPRNPTIKALLEFSSRNSCCHHQLADENRALHNIHGYSRISQSRSRNIQNPRCLHLRRQIGTLWRREPSPRSPILVYSHRPAHQPIERRCQGRLSTNFSTLCSDHGLSGAGAGTVQEGWEAKVQTRQWRYRKDQRDCQENSRVAI